MRLLEDCVIVVFSELV